MVKYLIASVLIVGIGGNVSPESLALADDAHSTIIVIDPFAPSADVLAAAEHGKEALGRLARNDRIARELGFLSAAEAAGRKDLLTPFPVFRVQVNRLPDFAFGARKAPDPRAIVVFGKEYIYPVAVNRELRSSVTVTHFPTLKTQWRTTEWGARGLIGNLASTAELSKADTPFALAIPELSRYFLGTFSGGFFIIPLYSEPKLGLKKGVPVAAEIVFSRIATELPGEIRGLDSKLGGKSQ
jgi:hypothetical protein